MEEGFAKCDRNGCKRKFKIAENTETSCNHHPGKPIFCDLKKGWTCCNQIVYDWDEFQALKTCAVGPHLPVQPKTEANPQDEFYKSNTVSNAQKGIERAEAAGGIVIKNIDEFNKAEEEKKKLELAKQPKKEFVPFVTPNGNYKCIHKGCLKEFKEAENTDESCKFHPGEPIFHDLKKFWSCCRVETWDWDEFTKLPTCAQGKHDAKMVEKV